MTDVTAPIISTLEERGHPKTVLLVTGLAGAGKSTTLKVLEDLGWEVVDNLPLVLLNRLLETPIGTGKDDAGDRPIAIGIDSRTRGFNADAIVRRIKKLREHHGHNVTTLFLDCAGAELERRFSETRRRHPLAEDRPATDGIARDRELTEPLRRWADHIVDTTSYTSNDLQQEIRQRFAGKAKAGPVLNVMSFGFSRGLPRNADLVFDMRFLRNPHWDAKLRPLTGLNKSVADYVRADPAYETAISQIEQLLLTLLPRYFAEGKSYVTIAFGCTGGKHRSVHVTERVGAFLKENGFDPNISHRNIPLDVLPDASVTRGERDSLPVADAVD